MLKRWFNENNGYSRWFNPFVSNATFEGVEKGCIGNKWFNGADTKQVGKCKMVNKKPHVKSLLRIK